MGISYRQPRSRGGSRERLWLGLTALLLCAGVAQSQPAPRDARPAAAAVSVPAPLSAAEQAQLEAPPNERPYQVRLHFLESNERRHDLFFPLIKGRGGSYLGVGADQNYTLAAVAEAELLWLVDIDGYVIDWHRIYSAVVPVTQSARELADLFAQPGSARVAAALSERYGATEAPPLLRAYQRDRPRLAAYLRRELDKKFPDGSGTWLSDPALYQRIRALMQARRVVARVGDLHGERTLLAIGAAAQRAQRPFQTVYLSNVEQWFRYSPQFQRNLGGLPAAPQALVLRTLARNELHAPSGDRWHFSAQTLSDFLARMASGELKLVQGLIPEMLRGERARGLSLLPAAPVALAPPAAGAPPSPLPSRSLAKAPAPRVASP